MCLAAKHGMLVCGNNSGQLVLIDPRISISPQTHTIPLHRGVITGLNIWNNYILSVGEDRKMGVTDFRMNQNILHQNVVNILYHSQNVITSIILFIPIKTC